MNPPKEYIDELYSIPNQTKFIRGYGTIIKTFLKSPLTKEIFLHRTTRKLKDMLITHAYCLIDSNGTRFLTTSKYYLGSEDSKIEILTEIRNSCGKLRRFWSLNYITKPEYLFFQDDKDGDIYLNFPANFFTIKRARYKFMRPNRKNQKKNDLESVNKFLIDDLINFL